MIEPSALAAARRSLEEPGFLLPGEVHGVRENPRVIRALMRAFGLSGLALEWPEDLASVAGAFLAGERLADHPLLWFGDGRITARSPGGLAGTCRSRAAEPDIVRRDHERGLELVAARRSAQGDRHRT